MYIRAAELNASHTGMGFSYTYEVDRGKNEVTPVKSGLLKIQKIEQTPNTTYITAFGVRQAFDKEVILFIKTDWVHEQNYPLDNQGSSA